uniref:Uncharacterized protein n=1 Tax=Arion vulgaris TaxID=1028688 RepID=A0A0B7A9T6_9EUPU
MDVWENEEQKPLHQPHNLMHKFLALDALFEVRGDLFCLDTMTERFDGIK